MNLACAARLSQLNISSTARTTGVHHENNWDTTVRSSIARSSVLPTIGRGVKVLKTILGGVRQSTTSWEGGCFGACTYTSIGTTVDLGTTGLNTVDLGTTTLNTFNLATTTLITVDLGTASTGARATVNLGTVQGENDYSFFAGNSLMETTIATNTITSLHNMELKKVLNLFQEMLWV